MPAVIARAAPSSTMISPREGATWAIHRRREAGRCSAGANQVPTRVPDRTRGSASALASCTPMPLAVASIAACTFVAMPPVPTREPAPVTRTLIRSSAPSTRSISSEPG